IGYKGAAVPTSYDKVFTLTWLDDRRTLGLGLFSYDLAPGSRAQMRYLDTTAPVGSLLAASRAVTPSFPPAPHFTGLSPKHPAPESCGLPVAVSDGTTFMCGGDAATGPNAAGFLDVGFWELSARTGRLTATWAPHSICCE